MIISASRRTDIPAFYSDWFFKRWREQRVLVRNPRNVHQVSEIELNADAVDCIVFWTKDPSEMISRHSADLLKLSVPFYFQFTINPYGRDIENNVPEKKGIIETFIALSKMIGKERVIWRYDPVIITDTMDCDYHSGHFERMARMLAPHTNKCTISFLDRYKKTERNMGHIRLSAPTTDIPARLGKALYDIASSCGLELAACAEKLDLRDIGIQRGRCIDPELIAHLCKGKVTAGKDKHQREECGCVESVDIGSYNTCRHGCLYCYANHSLAAVKQRCALHDPDSPLLFGGLEQDDRIVERKMKSAIEKESSLF